MRFNLRKDEDFRIFLLTNTTKSDYIFVLLNNYHF